MLCKAIKRYTKARKQEKKNGLAVDSSRQKSVTVTVKIDKLENKNEISISDSGLVLKMNFDGFDKVMLEITN